jgi:flagellar hook-basal body complex protein FliE
MAIAPIQSQSLVPVGTTFHPSQPKGAEEGLFGKLIDQILGKANEEQAQADQAIRSFAAGETDDLHSVILTVARADLTFRSFLEIRNRLTEAYQEIMRMQI